MFVYVQQNQTILVKQLIICGAVVIIHLLHFGFPKSLKVLSENLRWTDRLKIRNSEWDDNIKMDRTAKYKYKAPLVTETGLSEALSQHLR